MDPQLNLLFYQFPQKYNNLIATGFQFEHISGNITCGQNETTYWGCNNIGLNVYLFKYPKTPVVPGINLID